VDNEKEVFQDPNDFLPAPNKPEQIPEKWTMPMKISRGIISVQVVKYGKWYDYKAGNRPMDFKKARDFALACYRRDINKWMD
jgi:hypothetical protein